MDRKLKISFLFSLVCLLTYAQNDLARKYVKGDIVLNSGESIKGYIFFDFEHVGMFQNSVSYILQETYEELKETGNLKMKYVEKLKPKVVKYYKLEDGPTFVTETYADLTAVGTGSIPKKYFFEQMVVGKINLYKRYISSGGGVSGEYAELTMEGGEKLAEYNKMHFELMIKKDEKNPKNISNVNLLDYISDKADVLNKFNADEYGKLKAVFSKKVKLGDLHYPDFEEDLIKLLNDYNNE